MLRGALGRLAKRKRRFHVRLILTLVRGACDVYGRRIFFFLSLREVCVSISKIKVGGNTILERELRSGVGQTKRKELQSWYKKMKYLNRQKREQL